MYNKKPETISLFSELPYLFEYNAQNCAYQFSIKSKGARYTSVLVSFIHEYWRALYTSSGERYTRVVVSVIHE